MAMNRWIDQWKEPVPFYAIDDGKRIFVHVAA